MAADRLKQTKYQRIYGTLHERITSGTYRPGDRLPADVELVQQFGASRPTVARAVAELERGGLVYRQPGSGTYVRHVARADGQLFGLLVPGLGDTEIFEPVCGEVARRLQGRGHALLWGDSAMDDGDTFDSNAHAEALCREHINRRVAGVFFAPLELTPQKDEVNRRIISALDDAGIQVVLLDRDIAPYPRRSKHDLVAIDNRRTAFVATQHLIEQGCQRFAFVGQANAAPTVDARVAGFREALSSHGFGERAGEVWRGDASDLDFVRNVVGEAPPHGVLCANDVTAGALLHSFETLGVSVPGQTAVVAFDDVKYANLVRVPLTTIHQPCRAMGAQAVATMLDRLASPQTPARDILLDAELVGRRSSQWGGA